MQKSFLTLVKEKIEKKGSHWLNEYQCVCGNHVVVFPYNVKSGNSRSCGCKSNEFISTKNSTHNLSKHPLFKVWANMIARCYSENATKYPYYGAVGVRMCDEWRNNFKLFYDWAIANKWVKGMQVDKDTIPRKLGIPALLYSPETCCILTNKQNANGRKSNRLFEYNGEKKTISELADMAGIDQRLMRYRIDNWGVDLAMGKPLRRTKMFSKN